MPVHNTDISDVLSKTADLLEIKGENQFRIRAYRDAARTIGGLSKNVADMVDEGGDLSRLPGIGKDLASKIAEIVKKGTFPLLQELQKEIPGELSIIMKVAGLGAKRVKAIYEELGVDSLDKLKEAVENKRIRELEGFGEKTEQSILEGIKRIKKGKERLPIAAADQIAGPFLDYLKKEKKIKDIIVAGSYRRRRQTVKDLDILVTCSKGSKIMDRFINYEDVGEVISRGKTRSSIRLRSGFQVDLRVVPQVSYGSALHYFTGSKAHNIAVRKIAVSKGLKISEYGVFKGKKRVAGRSEESVYKKVGLSYIEPELRENRGEIEAARKKNLPDLIDLKDIRGDLHIHTNYTDGHNSLEEMAEAAQKKGYDYIAITDHSKKVRVAGGLDEKELAKEIKKIDKINKELKSIVILKGVEVDILEDGSLDLSEDILKDLDLTVCAIHSKFNLTSQKQTERIIRAMDNPNFNILAHPTGRRINEREPYDIDMDKIMKEAKKRGCILELNSHRDRLDLDDVHCKAAKDIGLKIAISTDSHSRGDLDFIKFGVSQARRGWIEAADVINTRSLREFKKILKRK
ncbi:MAG: DNA polymerase/3'-5' exonuclease PolX [Candidatus Omnitrophica bacterium]|nr:DNA polymerase/3'-5' exonuclease PolX [Candidatus Omnitrophota bacterium]MBD3269361.1 DNA polymerase/3'-5' exonuclease PolX [Candidatus Omnitrophota bacterium]